MDNMKYNIVLVAHDGCKDELIEWIDFNKDVLFKHGIFATGTTAEIIENKLFNKRSMYGNTKHRITHLLSGPLGGDQQIGAMIANGSIDVLIFFCDNLITQEHQQDISALMRLASLYNIAFATNRTTADMILTSSLFGDSSYKMETPAIIENYKNKFKNNENNI